MICCVCGETAAVSNLYEDFCKFHWDCWQHERKIRFDAIRDFGEGYYIGPNFGVTYYGFLDSNNTAGFATIGYCLLVSRYPHEAMAEALRIAARNDWRLLRLDVQAAAEKRLGLRSCTNIFVSPEFQNYMEYSDLPALPYDAAKYGEITL